MNEKRFTIIWVVALVIILLSGGAAIWYLQFDVLVEKRRQLDVVRGQVNDAKQKQAKIPGLEKSIADLTKQAEELATHIPNLDRAEYDVFAELIDELRRKASVTVPRVTWAVPGRPAPIPGRPVVNQPATIHKVQYDITASGSFYQLLRYINLIEQQRRFIGVENFTIMKGGDTTKGVAPRRDLRITIYSYTYKLPAQPFFIEAPEERSGRSTDIPD